ncbi:MAG: hypothetical protein A2041_04405 [Bacteroidetes bacterium GWA2_31_9b]|nr:MAG: hypothetical protein A2041_04405 [Bacteroidetes bacterium GWA2_31_9b]
MSKNLFVSCIQTDLIWENKELNLLNFEKKIQQLPKETQLVILPEMFTTGFSMKPEHLSESMNEKSVKWLKIQSQKSGKIIIGSIIVKELGKNYNRLLVAFPNGSIQKYDKRHLFRMGNENAHYSKGDDKLIFTSDEWRICPLICYDLRFPVWSRNKNDYDLLIYIANWPKSRSYAWKSLLVARAIENQAYVIGVNRIGSDGQGNEFSGDSMIIDPYGQIITQAEPFKEQFLNAELSLDELNNFRTKFPVNFDVDEFKIVN